MKKFIVFLATTLILGALGFGAFTFIQNIHLFDYFSETTILTKSPSQKKLYELKYSDNELPFDIFEYPYEYPASKKDKPKYFFGDKKRIEPLIQKFKDEVNYGPEIMGLKNISINDLALYKLGSSGTYYPGTSQINLQTKQFPNELLKNNKLKIQWIHEILAHEYAHHLFYIYVSSPHPLKDKWKDPLLDYGINEKEGKMNYVNKVFLEKFKDIFNYNSDVLLSQAWKFKTRKILSSMYSLKELFDFANKGQKIEKKVGVSDIWPLNFSKEDLVSRQNFWEDLIINFDKYNIHLSKIQNLKSWKIISTEREKIKYYYSLSELLARKYTLSTIPWSEIDTKMLSNKKDKKFVLLLEADRQRVNNRFVLNKKINYIDYFQDNPFRPLNISFREDNQKLKEEQLQKLRNDLSLKGNHSNNNLIYESRLRNHLLQKIEKASSKKPQRQIVDAFMELILDYMGANDNYNISVMFPKK